MKKNTKKMLITVLFFITAVVLAIWIFLQQPQFGQPPSGERLARIEKSPNYKSGAFTNLSPTPNFSNGANYFTVMRELFVNNSKRIKPRDTVPHIKTNLTGLDPKENVLVWFGHSSYFIQLDGKRMLVDPVFSPNASPVSFTTKSFPGTNIYGVDDMPEIDYLFITHDHWDHLDYKTIHKLRPKVRRVICPLGVGAHFERWKYDPAIIFENDWGDSLALDSGFVVHTTPARHFSGRTFRRNQTLWVSYVLQTPSMKIYIGGDSGFGGHFEKIGEEHGPFDLAILENGQYNNYWKYIHMLPEELLPAARALKTKNVMPVHAGKFPLSSHAWDEPFIRVSEENKKYGLRLVTPKLGEPVYLKDSTQLFQEWWKGLN